MELWALVEPYDRGQPPYIIRGRQTEIAPGKFGFVKHDGEIHAPDSDLLVAYAIY